MVSLAFAFVAGEMGINWGLGRGLIAWECRVSGQLMRGEARKEGCVYSLAGTVIRQMKGSQHGEEMERFDWDKRQVGSDGRAGAACPRVGESAGPREAILLFLFYYWIKAAKLKPISTWDASTQLCKWGAHGPADLSCKRRQVNNMGRTMSLLDNQCWPVAL